MKLKYNQTGLLLNVFIFAGFISCTKLVQVPEPINTITNSETFGSDATANSAIAGIYNDILTGHGGSSYDLSFGNGLITIDAAMSADEFHSINGNSPFEVNALNSVNFPSSSFWNGPYFDIYLSNAAITGLQSSTGVSPPTRNQLTGEAKFLRAFCYFYLVNLFGDVPLVTTTAYSITDTLSRTPTEQVYKLIISDLHDAQALLPNDYSVSDGARIRVNQSGASALLSRVYLFEHQWDSAEACANSIIANTSLYGLCSNLDSVFLANSFEAILQWQVADIYPYATKEANTLIPTSSSARPNYYLTNSLLESFETGDQRRINWVDSTKYSGKYYYFPYKYKVRVGSSGDNTENYMVFRLAEQYLIRAEARAQQNTNLNGAISDLNTLRERSGLSDLPDSLTQAQVLTAVQQERRIELFAEWGSRWLDLKRIGQAITILSNNKGFNVSANALLFPIPATELINDANLIQNPGY